MFGFDHYVYHAEIMHFKAVLVYTILIYSFLSTHIQNTRTESGCHMTCDPSTKLVLKLSNTHSVIYSTFTAVYDINVTQRIKLKLITHCAGLL